MTFWNTFVENIFGSNTDRRSTRNSQREDRRLTSTRGPPSPVIDYGSRRAQNGGSAGAGYQGTSQSAEIHRRDLQQRVEELQLELDRTKKELSLTKQELESARVFANKADAISETDIITKLNSLNDIVYQTASAIADAHENNGIRISADIQSTKQSQFTIAETDRPNEKQKQFFEESLCRLVMDVKRQPTHARVLVSLQACMIQFCTMILSSEFSSIVNRERTEVLQQIFNDMKVSQPKAVSARWRALAYSHGEVLMQDQQQLFQLLGSGIRTLYGFPKKKFETMFGEELSGLVNSILQLRKMMYGDYVSGDVEVFSFLPRSEFNPEKMQVDDPRRSSRTSATGPILCTTSMGIARRLHIRRHQGDKWVNKDEYNVLLKANVLMGFDDN
ncbi:hypothetical protein AX14_011304 [Amanita brunnescens Koide BX004]|nr:hypothetical protein AX14_011304 [Amanita brunnescens Koide BX004]